MTAEKTLTSPASISWEVTLMELQPTGLQRMWITPTRYWTRPLLLSMQYALCINGSSERRRLTTPPTNMTRWNMALRLESKDSIMPWTKWLVAWSNDLVTTHSAFECSKDCLPGYIIHCLNVISSPNFVLWRIFARMPGRLRRLVSIHGTLLKVPPLQAIILDPSHLEPKP